MIPTRTRDEGCLADFTLDRKLAGELSEEEQARVGAHLDQCARCTERYASLDRARGEFAAQAPALTLARRRTRTWPRWLGRGGAALAVAAAALLLLRAREAVDEGTRTKGSGALLEVYVSHRGEVRRGRAGEVLAPGDAIRFVVTSQALPYVAILSLDGAGHASVYYPSSGEVPRIPLGAAFALPESTLLDDTLGEERIFALFCPRAFATEPLRLAMEAAPGTPPRLDGCAVEPLVLRKERANGP